MFFFSYYNNSHSFLVKNWDFSESFWSQDWVSILENLDIDNS